MRYYIYKDSEVAGPFTPEELDASGGVAPDSLVCPEASSGRYDNDWLAAGQVSELSSVRRSLFTATATLDEPLAGESGVFERLELDTAGLPGVSGEGDGWLADLMDDAQFRSRWGELLPKPSEDAEELAQAKISNLTSQLEALKSRISELEIYKSARSMTGPAPSFEAPPPSKKPPLPVGAPFAPAPALSSAPPPLETIPSAIAPELPPDLPSVKIAAAPAQPSTPAAPAGPHTDFEKKGEKFTFKGVAKGPAPGAGPKIRFAPSKEFRVVEKEPHPAELPIPTAPAPSQAQGSAPVYEWNAPPQGSAPGGLPAAGSAPMPALPTSPATGPSLPSAPPASGAPPPLPAFGTPTAMPSFGAPSALPSAPGPLTSPPSLATQPPQTPAAAGIGLEAPSLAPPSLTAPPPSFNPLGFGAPPMTAPPMTAPPAASAPSPFNPPATFSGGPVAPPMTMMFGAPMGAPAGGLGGVPPLEAPPVPQMPGFGAMTPSRANAGAITPSGPATDDVIARLAKPAAPPATDKKPERKKSRAMLIVGVVGLLALFVLIFFFLRDRQGLKKMIPEGAAQKPFGGIPDEEPKIPAPAPAPKPAPTTPAPAPDKIPDAGEAAVTLVKNYPLAGNRGTVGQWLTYSYNQDGASKEDWNPGALDATTYLVEYKVLPGPSSKSKEVISYLFEADTGRQIIQGKNPAAKSLLGGGETVAPKPKKAAKPVYKKKVRKPKAAAAPSQSKKVDLLPLPSDAELAPPADDSNSFKSDTVE